MIAVFRIICVRTYNTLFTCYVLGLRFMISESNKRIYTKDYEVRKGTSSISISLESYVALTGDIRVDFFNRPKMKRKVYLLKLY